MPGVFWKPLPGGVQPFKFSRTTLVTPPPHLLFLSCSLITTYSMGSRFIFSFPSPNTKQLTRWVIVSQRYFVQMLPLRGSCLMMVWLPESSWRCVVPHWLFLSPHSSKSGSLHEHPSIHPCLSAQVLKVIPMLEMWMALATLKVPRDFHGRETRPNVSYGSGYSVSRCTALWKLNLPISQKHLDPPSVVLASPQKLASDCPEVICQGNQLLRESKASFPEACAKLCFCAVFWGSCVYVPSGWAGSTYNSWGSRERVSSQRGVRGLRQIVIGVLWEGLNLNENWVPYLHQILMTSNFCQES